MFDSYFPRKGIDIDVVRSMDDDAFYMVSNDYHWIVRVVDEAQLKLLHYCSSPFHLNKTGIARLLNDSCYHYYESVDAFVDAQRAFEKRANWKYQGGSIWKTQTA